MKPLMAAIAAILMTTSSAVASCDSGELVIRFSHVVAGEGHPKGDAANYLASRINEEMDGVACMIVYPNATLFDDDKVMEALLLGDVQLAAPSLAKLEPYTLKYRLFELPFLFFDLSAVSRFMEGDAGRELLMATEDAGFTGLGYWSSGLKQFSANRPLINPEDARGLRFRIQTSAVADAMISTLGASSQMLAFREVTTALRSGVVDGQENSWSNIYTQGFHRVQEGITETNHQVLAYLLVTSTTWLETLEPEVREQFISIVEEVSREVNADVVRQEMENRARIIADGVPIRTLSPSQRLRWIATMHPVWESYKQEIGEELISAAISSNMSN